MKAMSSGRSPPSVCLTTPRSAAWGRDAARQRRRRHHFEQLPLYSIPSGKSAVELRALFGVPVELEGSTAHTMPYRCLGVGPDREQQLRLGKSKHAAWLQNERAGSIRMQCRPPLVDRAKAKPSEMHAAPPAAAADV
ncbi:hypothetical protein L1887_55726 [Cichorium endivia]|nr:hypothetical protein L1887_55726 [Cichorium endivia]